MAGEPTQGPGSCHCTGGVCVFWGGAYGPRYGPLDAAVQHAVKGGQKIRGENSWRGVSLPLQAKPFLSVPLQGGLGAGST